MRRMVSIMTAVVCSGILFVALPLGAADAGDDAAIVTLVVGKAHVLAKGERDGKLLKKKDLVRKGQEVRVDERSRLELKYPDGTIMRFAERSVVTMDELFYDRSTEKKNLRVQVGFGKLWASVKRLVTPDSKVEVKTVNAVAGVRGTTYRVNVEADTSALIRVYDGFVDVSGTRPAAPASPPQGMAPVPVAGPHEVPPPYHEVTMEEWHVIVKSFQQVAVSPNGVASEPQDFTAQQDRDDWVLWNQERDGQQHP
jgi:hypothetical protein